MSPNDSLVINEPTHGIMGFQDSNSHEIWNIVRHLYFQRLNNTQKH